MSGDADYVRGYSVSGDTVCQVIHYVRDIVCQVIQCVRGYSVSGDTVCQGMQTMSGDIVCQVIQCIRWYTMSGDIVSGDAD